MLGHYFYANNPLEKEEVETLFLRLMAGDDNRDDTYDDDHDMGKAGEALAALHQALWPHRDAKGEETEEVHGDDAFNLFRKSWLQTYSRDIASRGYGIKIGGEPINLKDEEHVSRYFENGNFCEPPIFEDKWFSMGRGLCIKAGRVFGEIDAARSAAMYDYARAEDAKEKAQATKAVP